MPEAVTVTETGGEAAPFTEITLPKDTPESLSPRDAARRLASIRWGKDKETSTESAETAVPVEQELPSEGDAAPVEGQPSGETEATEPEANLPPIEPPRFWTSEAKDRFGSLPRETQQYIVDREQARDAEVRRTQNEAAEKLKALEADQQLATQARAQYEQALPALLQTVYDSQAGEFADIKSMADVERMAAEDFPRYARWDAQQKKIAALQAQVMDAQQRQILEFQQRWSHFAQSEDQKFAEKYPDISDPAKASKIRDSAISILKDRGFNDQELGQLWSGQASISLRDHRLQLLILDAMKWRDAEAKAKTVQQKSVPPVQRPGVSLGKNAQADAEIQALKAKLDRTGSAKDAAAVVAAQRRLAQRRA